MTFELLFKDKFLVKNTWVILPFAFFSAIIGQLLGMLFFREYAGIVGIAFTTIPLVQVFMQLMKDQEKHIIKDHKFVLKHSILIPFMYMFIGLVLSYTMMYSALPDTLREDGFSQQIDSIYDLDGPFGFAIFNDEKAMERSFSCLSLGIDKNNYPEDLFDFCHRTDYDKDGNYEVLLEKDGRPAYIISEKGEMYYYNNFLARHIFLNNTGVLIFIFMTSFIFGTGAIFILVWNASIVGVFLGDALHKTANFMSGNIIYAYTLDLPKLIGPLLVHGIFEFTGFFIAAIAGGILSIAMLKHKLRSKAFHSAVFTSITITLISVVLLLIGAIVESYI